MKKALIFHSKLNTAKKVLNEKWNSNVQKPND